MQGSASLRCGPACPAGTVLLGGAEMEMWGVCCAKGLLVSIVLASTSHGTERAFSTVLGSNHACIGVEGKDYFLGVCVFLSSGQGPRTVPLAEQDSLALCPFPVPPGVSGVSQGSVAPCCCCPDCVTHKAGGCQGWGASV